MSEEEREILTDLTIWVREAARDGSEFKLGGRPYWAIPADIMVQLGASLRRAEAYLKDGAKQKTEG